MGQEISFLEFNESDYLQFKEKLHQETQLLERFTKEELFSNKHPVAGFEIEAWLVDKDMQPAPLNELYLKDLNSHLVSAELARFNIEFNSIPQELSGKVFSDLQKQLQKTWNAGVSHAQSFGLHLMMIGTLPTVEPSILNLNNISNLNRYYALNQQILAARGEPVRLDIIGNEHLKLIHHDVMLESIATSFQIHIQLPLSIAHHFYNASMISSAAMVAICANTPFLFGKDLWHESRIPLFEQAIETGGYNGAAQGPLKRVSFGSAYAKNSILECFTENLLHFPPLLPAIYDSPVEAFEHLRLHNGTVWRWNRPLIGFDDDGIPHIRVEHRTPAAGATVIDSIANSAFFYGLTYHICEEIAQQGLPIPFSQAKDNFYQASRFGLDSHITWKNGEKSRLHALLKKELLPRAKLGLQALDIAEDDINHYLEIIEQRVMSKQNGSQWQREFIQQQGDFKAMTASYLTKQQQGEPVGTWSLV